MAQIPNLDNAPVNLTSIREQSQKELLNILKNVRGKKCLVIDPKLGDSLSLIIQTSILKEHGVELRHLSSDPIQTDCSKVVYLVHAQPKLMKFICSNIHNDLSKGLQREYHVYFVPRRTVVCEKVLEEEKLHHMVSIGEYPLYIVPMDEDVLSFELDLSYKECQVDGDTGSLWHIAKAIHKLEFSFGVIPNVRAKGKASVCVADILNRMQAEEPVNSSDIVVPEINTLILLDREVDMVTPLCSQLTYEGLLDEAKKYFFLHINNGSVELDASIMGLQQEGKKTKVPLNSSDKLFKEIRDLNFEVVVQILRQKATSMKQDYTEMTTTTQTVSELKDFVKKLNSLPEMTRHINLAQHLSTFTSKPSFLGQLDMEHTIVESQSYDICFDYIEELIHKQEPLTTVLRLLILFSITNSGLPKKHFDYFRRELLHSYGFEHVAMLNNLEKAGLFKKQESKSNWVTIKRALQLVVEDTDTANPNDIAYVFSGYAPLSIRLVQHAIRSGWRPVEEILKLLPGPHLETKRGGFSNSPSFDTLSGVSTTSLAKVPDGRRALVLVVFVGGVTFAEISALRFFSTQEGMAYDLIIATTKIVNGQSLIEPFMEKLG
ncbi:lysine-specific histone demethylase 1 [Vigna unguiculata]|uniref:Lysine-specific histone demethylase 1 n=1 Tax=Vigna unguiculata TaxID=3917 RepID=A0A4D6N7K5_VIGUN|nr:lysine-specific histone demethylase 1 [Vigna unguiculata]